jgi:hypothetical protein
MTDAYPFGLSPAVAKKLRFVHDLVLGARAEAGSPFAGSPFAGSPFAEDSKSCATHSSGSSASPSLSS